MSWVLSIGNGLGMRGHNVPFLTVDHYTRLGKSSPYVKTVSLGKGIDVSDTSKFTKSMKRTTKDFTKFAQFGIGYMYTDFERNFMAATEYFKNNDIDLAICDHYADPCYSATSLLQIPYVITSAFPITEDSAAPYVNHQLTRMTNFTTEFQSFTTRLGNKFLAPFRELYYLLPTFNAIAKRKRAMNIPAKIEDPGETWKRALKLVNTMNGFTPARPVGPLVEFIGPIIPSTYPPLTDDLQAYLDAHERVAYIAFSQMATPLESDVELILTG